MIVDFQSDVELCAANGVGDCPSGGFGAVSVDQFSLAVGDRTVGLPVIA